MRSFSVLIVTDDASLQAMLCRSVSAQPALRIAGCCCDVSEAEKMVEQMCPDVIALDMQIPESDCVALTGRLAQAFGASVVAMSTSTAIALATFNAGAADFVYIPERGSNSDYSRFLSDAVDRLKIAAMLRWLRKDPEVAGEPCRASGLAVIAASPGGPVPLACLVRRMPEAGPAVLAVQWQASAFCADFCRRLSAMTGRNVWQAADDMEMKPGEVYVVAGNRCAELILDEGKLVLQLGDVCMSRDAQAEALFRSAAALPGEVSGVLLYDSAAGESALKALAARGMPAIKLNKNAILLDTDYEPEGGVIELPLEDVAPAMLS